MGMPTQASSDASADVAGRSICLGIDLVMQRRRPGDAWASTRWCLSIGLAMPRHQQNACAV
eukprot:41573-Pyramimonas_sp.AAC.1